MNSMLLLLFSMLVFFYSVQRVLKINWFPQVIRLGTRAYHSLDQHRVVNSLFTRHKKDWISYFIEGGPKIIGVSNLGKKPPDNYLLNYILKKNRACNISFHNMQILIELKISKSIPGCTKRTRKWSKIYMSTFSTEYSAAKPQLMFYSEKNSIASAIRLLWQSILIKFQQNTRILYAPCTRYKSQ